MGYTPIQPDNGEAGTTDAGLQLKYRNRLWLHILLFVVTVFTTVMAGASFLMVNPDDPAEWYKGFLYSGLVLAFLSAHEFGHYFAARFHKVITSLPFYIPVPPMFGTPFGTMGAVIRIRSKIPSRKALFDIAAAGPIAGFVVCLVILAVGVATLPSIDYLYSIHPEFRTTGLQPVGMYFGDSIAYSVLNWIVSSTGAFFPPMNEIYHYPFLCVGWFGMFVTALNMMPVGQLDGGHILYAMFGKRQHKYGEIFWLILLGMGTVGLINTLYDVTMSMGGDGIVGLVVEYVNPLLKSLYTVVPYVQQLGPGWLLWAVLIRFFIGIKHPVIDDAEPLSKGRRILGWIAFAIFILCFAPNPISIR